MKQKTKRILKRALLVLLCITVLGGAVAGIVVATDKVETKGVTATWAIGGLDENGDYQKTDKSIYTKNAFDCNGLKVNLDFDSTIEYQIYFYDFDNEFLSNTEMLQISFKGEVPMEAKSARIVIRPLKNDDKLNIFNIPSLSGQIEIKVAKEQYETAIEKIENRANLVTSLKNAYVYQGFVESSNSPSFWTNVIDVNGLDKVVVCVDTTDLDGDTLLMESSEIPKVQFLANSQTTASAISSSNMEILDVKDGNTYFIFDVSSYSTIRFSCSSASYSVFAVYEC